MASDETRRPGATEPKSTEEMKVEALGPQRPVGPQRGTTWFDGLRRPPPARQRINGHEIEPSVGGGSLEDCLQEVRIEKLHRYLETPEAREVDANLARSEEADAGNSGVPSELEEASRLHTKNGSRERDRAAILQRQTVVDGQGRRNGEPLLSDPSVLFGQVQLSRKRGSTRSRTRQGSSERQLLCDQVLDAELHREFLKALIADCREQALGFRKDTLQLELLGLLIEQFRKRPRGASRSDLERHSAADLDEVIDLGEDEIIRRGNNKLVADRLMTTIEEVEKCVKRFDRTVVRTAKSVLEQRDKGGAS
jgi:hypothetical protein